MMVSTLASILQQVVVALLVLGNGEGLVNIPEPGFKDERPVAFSRENSFCTNTPSIWPVFLENLLGTWYLVRYQERIDFKRPNDCSTLEIGNYTVDEGHISVVTLKAKTKTSYTPESKFITVESSALAGFIGPDDSSGMKSGRMQLTTGGLYTGNVACGTSGACGSLIIVGATKPPRLSDFTGNYDSVLYMTCQMQYQGRWEPIPLVNEMGILSRTASVPDYAQEYYDAIIEKLKSSFDYFQNISEWNNIRHSPKICNN